MVRTRRRGAVVGALVVLGVLAVATPVLADGGWTSLWNLPEDISTYGVEIDHLYFLILGITGFTFFVTEILLVIAVIRFRKKGTEKALHTHGNHKLEVAWTIVPGGILLFIALYQARTWAYVKMDLPKREECQVVQVFSKQFEWNFRYAGLDGEFGTDDDVNTINKLHVPVDKKVFLEMRTLDVIHSLFIPNLRFKQDLLPGVNINAWFEATKTTEQARTERNDPDFDYEIACTELCGIEHYNMRARIIIQSQDEFERWEAEESKAAAEYVSPEIWASWDGVVESPKAHADTHGADHDSSEH